LTKSPTDVGRFKVTLNPTSYFFRLFKASEPPGLEEFNKGRMGGASDT